MHDLAINVLIKYSVVTSENLEVKEIIRSSYYWTDNANVVIEDMSMYAERCTSTNVESTLYIICRLTSDQHYPKTLRENPNWLISERDQANVPGSLAFVLHDFDSLQDSSTADRLMENKCLLVKTI